MGLDDRDYMRDRYRKRRGLSGQSTRWNDKKSRVERDDDVPLGSASWIGKKDPGREFELKNPGYKDRPKGTARGGPWFEQKNQGFDYQKSRWRPKRAGRRAGKARMAWAGKLILPLILLTYGVRMYTDAKHWDFLPDIGRSEPFPKSGEFKVRRAYAAGRTVPFTVVAGDRKAVIQLLDAKSKPIFAIYVRANETAQAQAPRGTWIMRLIEGRMWQGDEQFFGPNTMTENTVAPQSFLAPGGFILDLRRRLDGNLPTEVQWTDPTF